MVQALKYNPFEEWILTFKIRGYDLISAMGEEVEWRQLVGPVRRYRGRTEDSWTFGAGDCGHEDRGGGPTGRFFGPASVRMSEH